MNSLNNTSLETYFRNQAIRWGMIGLGLTLLFAAPCVLYSAKTASERQALYSARSAVRAFRPMILEDKIREAEFQIRKALDLQPGESATIYDPAFTAIFPLKEENRHPHCRIANRFCWGNAFGTLSVLQPIYFDDHKEEGLFGYLELTLKPTLDLNILSALVVLLLAAFIVQAFGLSSALSQSAKQIISQLSFWAAHLKHTPGKIPETRIQVPFTDLKSMQEAVDGLYIEIEMLQRSAAKEASIAAQVAILNEIGHDLKTPHSLLAKYFALVVDTVSTTGKLKPIEVANVERTLKRMGDLLRQVHAFSLGGAGHIEGTPGRIKGLPIEEETITILNDFRFDPEFIEKNLAITFKTEGPIPKAYVSQLGYYRILENILRNSTEALGHEGGLIAVTLKTMAGIPVLTIQDNGPGITDEILPKIFDFEFTTKPQRGTGLGLGIVNNICTQYSGEVLVTSAVGKGTTVTLILQPCTFDLEDRQGSEQAHGFM